MAALRMVVLELRAERFPHLRTPVNASGRRLISCENAVSVMLGREQRVRSKRNKKLQHNGASRPRKLPLLAMRLVKRGLESVPPIDLREAQPALDIQAVRIHRQMKVADGRRTDIAAVLLLR